MITKEEIVGILNNHTEDNEMIQGDVVSYVPDCVFTEVAEQIINKLEQVSKLPIHGVSHYYLLEGDTINRGDEFQNTNGDNRWRITGQDNQVFKGKKHFPHRRKL